MLGNNFQIGTVERGESAQPFIDDNPQRILIASRQWPALKLLWSHVRGCSNLILQDLRVGIVGGNCYAEITEPDLILRTKQHIFRLYIAVDKQSIMSILECRGNGPHVGDDRFKWE